MHKYVNVFDFSRPPKEDLNEMSWKEISELTLQLEEHNLYDEFVEYFGNTPHYIKHNYQSTKLKTKLRDIHKGGQRVQ